MATAKTPSMPNGLPARFADPDTGFPQLCEFLEIINRTQRQSILNIESVRRAVRSRKAAGRKLPTAKRLRMLLTAFYSLAKERRELWQHTHNEPSDVPSIEYHALRGYNARFTERNLDEERVVQALAEFPGVVKSIADAPEWQRPALTIWPDLLQDLFEWDSLETDRQDAAAIAVFAVATILDDSRFLHWAAARVDALADEWAFVLAVDAREPEQAATERDGRRSDATEPQKTDGDAVEPTRVTLGGEVSDVVQKWTQTCSVVAECASTLGGDPPQPERLGDLREHVKVLEQLHDPVVAFLDVSRRKHVVAAIADIVATLADDRDIPLLRKAVDQIHAQWKLTYLTSEDTSAEQLRADVARVERDLPSVVGDWLGCEDECKNLHAELLEIRAQPKADLTSRLSAAGREATLQAAVADATKRTREGLLSVLRVVAPEGHEFSPSRDYVHEWLDGTSGRDSVPAELTPCTTEPHAVLELAADSNEVGSVTEVDTVNDQESPLEDAASIIRLAPSSDGGAASADEHREVSAETPSASAAVVPEVESLTSPGAQFKNAIAALWQSVDERPGIAYHIARLLADQECQDPSLPPTDLVAAAILAESVQSADDAVVAALRPILARIEVLDLSREDVRFQDALNLMLFCATFRPALFAPVTVAAPLLRRVSLSGSLAPVAKLADVVAGHAEGLHGVHLDGALLEAASSNTAWEKKFNDLSERVEKWRDKGKKLHILSVPAHRVWTRWLRKDGCLGRFAGLIETNDPSVKGEIMQHLERFSDRKELSALVKGTDCGNVSGKVPEIIGRALTQLQAHVRPACDLGTEWLRLMDARPNPKGFVDRVIAQLRRDLGRYGQPALKALDQCCTESVAPLRSTAVQARHFVDGLLRSLDNDRLNKATGTDRVKATPETLLLRDLLYVTTLDLDLEGQPANGLGSEELVDLLADTGAHALTMSVACDRRLQQGNVAGARLACDDMENAADPEFDRCRSELDRKLSDLKSGLIRKLAQLKEDTEQAFCFGQLSDHERNRLSDRIVKAELALDGTEFVERAQVDVGEIKRSIESSRAKLIAQARKRFQSVSDNCSDDARDYIEKCIDDGYLLAANELISKIYNKGTIESFSAALDDPFQEFISTVGKGSEADDTADDLKPDAVVRAVTGRQRVAGISFESLSREEAAEAEHLLTKWYHLSTTRRIDDPNNLNELLLLFGFQVRKLKQLETGRGWAEMSVETDAIRDRSICSLPHFGSEAKGRYRLLLNWVRPVSESMARIIGGGASEPTIIIHFGRLGRDREKLRRLAITKQRSFLVIDESLVWYLAARRTERLAALFRCTLPFSAVEPYVTTSGLVPPELFYGRARERRSIMDRHGTCFIYGGRQLGKTALLRTVERDFHNPRSRHLAKWIDLKVGAIGSARGRADEIWSLLWHELRDLPILATIRKPNPGNQEQIDAMIGEIEQWVNARDDNRFLLLLDEADDFLATDALTDFRESTRLKGLMDRTERRFKVVLAGLHNVLRATEQSNHPLAHFGEPICVGPLLTNGEWEQAHKLVCEPLLSVGCYFEQDALATRILAHTNYYPSLIQLYGAELVRQLRDSNKPFPYVITSKDIDTAYRDTGLRNAIRERFLWTLQLDQRYEVVAYTLAHELLGHGLDINDSVEGSKIAMSARDWWPIGLHKTTDAQFNVLLDEMTGLGVLRSVDEGRRYTLRNPNILLLLGNIDDIESALLEDREIQDNFDPSTFRPQYSPPKSATRYAPLTHEQAGQLMGRGGVTVIAGTMNGHVDLVPEYLAVRGGELFTKLSLTKKIDDFKHALVEFQPKSSNVTHIVLVPPETPWTGEWLKEARGVLKRKKHGRWVRLVLLVDPETLWRVLREPGLLDATDVNWCVIRPWQDGFVRCWLDDNTLPCAPEYRAQLLKVTGGWPVLLERFIRRRRNNEWKKRIESMQKELAKPSEKKNLLRGFGITSSDLAGEMLNLGSLTSEYSEETVQDIADAAQMNAGAIRHRMEWSERLGLVTRTGAGWMFDPLVMRLLTD